jgi:hypothetical protein
VKNQLAKRINKKGGTGPLLETVDDCFMENGTDHETKVFRRMMMIMMVMIMMIMMMIMIMMIIIMIMMMMMMMMMMMNFMFHVVRFGHLFLGDFANLRDAAISFVMSVCLSINPSVRSH